MVKKGNVVINLYNTCAYSKPVIASPIGINKELIIPGKMDTWHMI